MSGEWVVIVAEGTQFYNAKVYGPFVSEDVARALAQGFMSSASGKQSYAIRVDKP